jgi:phosphatidylglycerol:prolipoprotein diacylglycerol transferase
MSWTYAFLMGTAITAGVLVSRLTQRSLGLSRRQKWGLGLGAFCGGMIGAKLPFVLLDPDGLLSGAAWFDNGKTIMFGLIGAYAGVEAVKWGLDIRVKTGDGFAAPAATAIAFGRLGCFSAGCCYGTVTRLPWGVDFGDGLRRHPTQLYEFLFHLTCAVTLLWLGDRGYFKTQLIKLYIIAYLVYRFLTEFIRPEPKLALGLSVYQCGAVLLIPVFVFLWIRDRTYPSSSRSEPA